MNKEQKTEQKIMKLADEFRAINSKIALYEKINTALPKKKAAKFDAILEPLKTQRLVLRFNLQNLLSRKGKA